MLEICPETDTFSYFMLVQPREKKREGGFTLDSCMAHMLVFLTLAVQGVLLYCVYDKVVVNNEQWRDGIMNTGESWDLFDTGGEECNSGNSLCTLVNGTFTCAPPSVQLSGRWAELDTNGDGIWTREEAEIRHDPLKCKYGLNSVEIFDVFNHIIMDRKDLIWIHPDVRAGKAIHKHYFDYARGDVIMCGYRNEDMCGNLLKRGVFDAPLKYGTSPRVGKTIDSALEYCRTLLQPRGVCEKFLPSSYATWKTESVEQCSEPKYSKFQYKHNGHVKSLLEVDYAQRRKYENARTPVFQVYKGIIVGVWILLIVSQLRGVFKILSWVLMIPGEDALSSRSTEEPNSHRSQGGTHKKKKHAGEPISGIDMMHRVTLMAVTLLRVFMLCVLMYVGLMFLARQTGYINLIMDGIALIFIIEVAEILYARVLRQEVRAKWEEHDPLWHTPFGGRWMKQRPAVADIFWLLVVLGATVGFIVHLKATLVQPLYEALDCTCLSHGETCRESSAFDFDFWTQYWRFDVPKTLESIEALRKVTEKTHGVTHESVHHHSHHQYHLSAM